MSRLVVDTSVAVKWFFPEAHSECARSVLEMDNELLAPDLLFPEFGNALWKRVRAGEITGDEAVTVLTALLQMPLDVKPSGPLAVTALEIANRTQRTVYDSLYLALAVSERARLLTADERFVNALRGTPLGAHIVWVQDAS